MAIDRRKHAEVPDALEGDLELEEMIEGNRQKYLLVNLLARRARDLNEGTRSLVDIEPPYTYLELAIAEAASGVLKVEHKESPKVPEDPVDSE